MSGSDFQMDPGFMQAVQGAQTGASTLITSAYSTLTSATLSSWSMVYGPLAIGNMIEALWGTSGNNYMSAIGTAFNHGSMAAATGVVDTTQVATDSVTEV